MLTCSPDEFLKCKSSVAESIWHLEIILDIFLLKGFDLLTESYCRIEHNHLNILLAVYQMDLCLSQDLGKTLVQSLDFVDLEL